MQPKYAAYSASASARATHLNVMAHSYLPEYLPSEVNRANRIMQQLEQCYNSKAFYISYRKNFVALKVSAPATVVSKRDLKQLERHFQASRFAKVVTKQGIIYRIPKI